MKLKYSLLLLAILFTGCSMKELKYNTAITLDTVIGPTTRTDGSGKKTKHLPSDILLSKEEKLELIKKQQNEQQRPVCDYSSGKIIGGTSGVIAGAIIGKKIGGDWKSAIIGGVIGGGAGYLIGNYVDNRRNEQCLLAKEEQMFVAFGDIKGNEVGLGNTQETKADVVSIVEPSSYTSIETNSSKPLVEDSSKTLQKESTYFKPNSSEMTDEFKAKIVKFSKTYAKDSDKNKKILIIGHTDDAGNGETNQKLSEERAKAVATIFKENGIKEENLFYRGEGEEQPVADNNNPAGRALNRRVEIASFDSVEAMETATQLRTPIPKYFSKNQQSQENKNVVMKQTPSTKIQKINARKLITVNEKKELKKPSTANAHKNQKTHNTNVDLTGISFLSAKPIGKNIGKPREDLKWYNQIPLMDHVHTAMTNFPVASAQAASIPMNWGAYQHCTADIPPRAQTKSLKKGEAIHIADYRAGLEYTKWVANIGTYKTTLSGVSVLMNDGADVDNYPKLGLFKNNQPVAASMTKIKTYDGEGGLLYRVFVQSKDVPIQCEDLVFKPNQKQRFIADAQIYYKKGTQLMVKSTQFKKELKGK